MHNLALSFYRTKPKNGFLLFCAVIFEFGNSFYHRQDEVNREGREEDSADHDGEVDRREFGVEGGRYNLHENVADTDADCGREQRSDDEWNE